MDDSPHHAGILLCNRTYEPRRWAKLHPSPEHACRKGSDCRPGSWTCAWIPRSIPATIPRIEIVGIAEPDQTLLTQGSWAKYGFDRGILFTDLESMLTKMKPQAGVGLHEHPTDHRGVVEICVRHGVHVMMEKPLAVNFEDALAIRKSRSRTPRFELW